MELNLFLRGIIIGFSIAAPVGPIGILCIRRTLSDGWLIGLVSGLGAATADALYGCIAGFGLTIISTLLLQNQFLLGLGGGIFLCYLGYKTFAAPPSHEQTGGNGTTKSNGLLGAYATTFVLTLTNPMTILSFIAIFAGLGLAETSGNYASALLLVAGVFSGSALWWLLLSGGASIVQKQLTSRSMAWINRFSGIIIGAFGLLALINLL